MTLNSTSAGRCLDIPPYGYQCIWWNTGGFVARNDTYNKSGYILFHVTVINIYFARSSQLMEVTSGCLVWNTGLKNWTSLSQNQTSSLRLVHIEHGTIWNGTGPSAIS